VEVLAGIDDDESIGEFGLFIGNLIIIVCN